MIKYQNVNFRQEVEEPKEFREVNKDHFKIKDPNTINEL